MRRGARGDAGRGGVRSRGGRKHSKIGGKKFSGCRTVSFSKSVDMATWAVFVSGFFLF
jgi:hypothetical protein